MTYRTILIDPPYAQTMTGGGWRVRHSRPSKLPYPTMSIEELQALPVSKLADADCHLWTWTTDKHLPDALDLISQWGFKYMLPVVWEKPSGIGSAVFIHRCQYLLFAYKGKCKPKTRFHPNIIHASPPRHSQKPEASYQLIEAVSHAPYVELFARQVRPGWTAIGNAIDGQDITHAIQ